MKPVKVVILNWNGRSHLERFLPVLVARTPGADIVVADNGSTDDSADFIRARFPQVELLLLDRNYGFAEGYNRALARIEADYCVLLNSDVEVTEGWLAPLVELLERDSAAAAVAPKIRSYANPGKFEYAGAAGGFIDFLGYPFCRGRILDTIESDRGQDDAPREVFWASGACMLVRSEVFRRLGGFDGDFFAHMEEIDFCWRAQLAGYRIRVEPRSTVFHVGGGTLPNNSPQKIYLNFRNNLCMLFKNLSPGTFWPVLFSRMVLDGMAALVFLVQGHPDFFKKVFRAHIDFHRQRKSLHEKRRAIQRHRVARPHGILRNSIILLHAFGYRTFDKVMR